MFKISVLEKTLKNESDWLKKEAEKAVFKDLNKKWSEAKFLPKNLREKLEKECPLEIKTDFSFSSKGQSTKALIFLDDGSVVETVLMKHGDGRRTACLSSQVGCPMNCVFCATGKSGFKRNLTVDEIVSQALVLARKIKEKGERLSSVVFMGMGEPFLNYDEVMMAIKILNDKEKFGIASRKISISTCGIPEAIEKLAKEPFQVNLAISLHSGNDNLRSFLMPINRKNSLFDVLKAVSFYINKTKRRVMIEYLMIKGVNDSEEQALELADVLKKKLSRLYFVNLIPYNQTGEFSSSSAQSIKNFKNVLEGEGVMVTQRFRFGDDIGAACGQLAGKNNG